MSNAVPPAGVRLPIRDESDLAVVRRHVREWARKQDLDATRTEALATAVTELARNVLDHAIHGTLWLEAAERDGRRGVMAIVRDHGPGIPDIGLAMQDGYTTRQSLGLGLPGARRLADDFRIESQPVQGTVVHVWKWSR
jgi:serine/threonine-protein kinase RsbT